MNKRVNKRMNGFDEIISMMLWAFFRWVSVHPCKWPCDTECLCGGYLIACNHSLWHVLFNVLGEVSRDVEAELKWLPYSGLE